MSRDLGTLCGFQSGYNALALVSEIGTDMSAWPTENSQAGWARVRASKRPGANGSAAHVPNPTPGEFLGSQGHVAQLFPRHAEGIGRAISYG